jgi:hypothetical protein
MHASADVAISANASTLQLVEPLFELAAGSSSLLGSRHPVRAAGRNFELPKFLLLGQRAGGTPIRVAVLAGLHGSRTETTRAAVRLLEQLTESLSTARDYALFVYPILDIAGFASDEAPQGFARRFAEARPDDDVRFFRTEVRKWAFSGIIELHAGAPGEDFHARAGSQIIAENVTAPALQAISAATTTEIATIPWLREELSHSPHPAPFELSFSAPSALAEEQSGEGLASLVRESLRHYRRLTAHAANL